MNLSWTDVVLNTLFYKDSKPTIDAMLCQKEIVKKIAKDNDYILALKGNHPLMEQEVKDFFLKSCTIDSERLYDL